MNGCNEILGRDARGSAAPVCVAASGVYSAKTRIWMVDDNTNFRTLLANLLNDQSGLECERGFSSPTAALQALSVEMTPEIILLDIEMGEHNGLDFIRPIKALAPNAHVLMLTTFAGPGARETAFREGASDFMLKTWTIEEISGRIRQAMEFGAVAGLLTTYLRGEKPMEIAAAAKKIELKSSGLDGLMTTLRGLFKFGAA